MFMKHCAFEFAPVVLFDFEYYSTSFILQEHMFVEQLLLEHNLVPKSHRISRSGQEKGGD